MHAGESVMIGAAPPALGGASTRPRSSRSPSTRVNPSVNRPGLLEALNPGRGESRGSTAEVQRGAEGPRGADGDGRPEGPGDEYRGDQADRRAVVGDPSGGVADLGSAGRDRRWGAGGHHDRGRDPDRRVGAGAARAAAGERRSCGPRLRLTPRRSSTARSRSSPRGVRRGGPRLRSRSMRPHLLPAALAAFGPVPAVRGLCR